MNLKSTVLILLISGLTALGCARNISYQHSINSIPQVANISITDKNGLEIYKGKSLPTRKSKAHPEFFAKDKYVLKFENKGFASKSIVVEYKSDGWYFGNVLLGGPIGLLIVDPDNGAMYQVEPKFFNDNLILSTASEEEEFKIFGINQIASEWQRNLVSLDR